MDCSIADLADLIADVTGFKGSINYDNSKPDGAPRKLMDSTRLKNLGWKPKYTLKEGLNHTYELFKENFQK